MAQFNPLSLFQKTARTIGAYRQFLAVQGLDPRSIKNWTDWSKVPVMDKKNYFGSFQYPDFFPQKKWPAMAYASSGSSGQPNFWFRDDEQEKEGGRMHEEIFRGMFQITKKEPTLVIICFSMGSWVAGNFTLASCRQLARRGYNLSVITPGVEKEDIFLAWRNLAPHFSRLVFAGYPPFLKDVLTEGQNRKLSFRGPINILTAGDKFSENWRKHLLSLLPQPRRSSVYGVYGSAEAGAMGQETPLSVFIRQRWQNHPPKAERFWSSGEDLPGLVQYNPRRIFFENVGPELVLTKKTAAPLIRYNIRDRGLVISFAAMKRELEERGWLRKVPKKSLEQWPWPFLVLRGRTDVAVTFYALNIYPEHLKSGLEHPEFKPFLSGNYLAYRREGSGPNSQELVVAAELADKIKPSARLASLIGHCLANRLREVNIEYRKLYDVLGEKARPYIKLCRYGKLSAEIKSGHQLLVQAGGKKPRKVL